MKSSSLEDSHLKSVENGTKIIDTSNIEDVKDLAIARELEKLKLINQEKFLSKRVPFLLNQNGFEMLVERNLANYTGSFVIMFFDGDKFKSVNDTYGHAFGDEAIVEMGRAIAGSSRLSVRDKVEDDIEVSQPRDVLGHVSGDEFCVMLMPNQGKTWNKTEAERAAATYEMRIAKLLSSGFTAKDKNGNVVTIKLGLTGGQYIGDSENGNLNVKDMTKIADSDLEEKKKEKKKQGKSSLENVLIGLAQKYLKKQGLR